MQAEQSYPRVALLVETSLSSGRDILIGIGQYVREHSPWSIYCYPHDLNQSLPKWFDHWEGDGIIARLQDAKTAELIAAKKVPVVDVLGVARQSDVPLVHVDNSAIAKMAADHLLDRGLQHFAYFGIANESWADERRMTFGNLIHQRGLSCYDFTMTRRQLERTDWSKLVQRVADWLGPIPRPFGIMLCSDVRGLLVREACRVAGLHVGSDVAMLGVGNDHTLCDMSTPKLSSIEADHTSVGYKAAAVLAAMMAGKPAPESPILVKPRYVAIRESTDFLAVSDPDVATAIQYIRNHACEGIGVEDVVRNIGTSRSVLQRRFRQQLRCTINEEIIKARLNRAMELLRQTDLSVAAIAEKTGFNYPQNMGKVFRKLLGQSPNDYRQSHS